MFWKEPGKNFNKPVKQLCFTWLLKDHGNLFCNMLGIKKKYSKKRKNNKETGNYKSCLGILVPNKKFNFFHNLIFSFQIV